MAFSTYTGASVNPVYTLVERMRIASTGNVGIGTTNPGNTLTVSGNSDGNNSWTAIQMDTKTGVTGFGGAIGQFIFTNAGLSAASIACVLDTAGAANNGALQFNTRIDYNTWGERMRITRHGYVGIGTATPSAALHVASSVYNTSGALSGIPNNGNGYYMVYNDADGVWSNWVGSWAFNVGIYSRWAIACGDHFVAASDERIKKNIQPVSGALDKIRRLDIVSYDRIDYRERGVDVGVVARNVQSVLPKAVNATKNTIPNIYLPATHLKIRSGVLVEVKCDDKDIKEGSKVRLMIMQGEKEVEHTSNMTNWTGSSFEVEEWKEYSEDDKVFAYGVEVDDFLNVDKDQIGILAAGAVKELVQIVGEQKEKVEDLTAKSDAQSREISELKRLVGSLLR